MKKLEKMKNDRDALTRKFQVLKKGISQQTSPHGTLSPKMNKMNLPEIKIGRESMGHSPRSVGETVYSGETWDTMNKEERAQAMGKKIVNEANILSRELNGGTDLLLLSNYRKEKRKDHMKSSKLSPFMIHCGSSLCVKGDLNLNLSPSHNDNILPIRSKINKKGDERKKEEDIAIGFKKKIGFKRPTHVKPDEYLKPEILKNSPRQKAVRAKERFLQENKQEHDTRELTNYNCIYIYIYI